MFPHQKTGSSGAVAQNARKKERSTKNFAAKAKKRDAAEKEVLKIEMMKPGFTVGELNLNTIDKQTDQLEAEMVAEPDELSGDEDELEDDELNGKNKKKETKRQTQPNRKNKYQVDIEDELMCHGEGGKPLYFEQYHQVWPCFHNANILEVPCQSGNEYNRLLLRYANEVLSTMQPQNMATTFPANLIELCRVTPVYTNMCFNPLQAIRAWTLLTNIADNKTSADLADFVYTYTGVIGEEMNAFNRDILSLHVSAEEDFDGCVRLFTELPLHMNNNMDLRRSVNAYYGGKSNRTAIQHLAFSTDSDGFYSCYRINHEISLSTNGAIRYVVPETHAPNWRASIVLASAMDCTFYWKVQGDASESDTMQFKCPPYGISFCGGIYATANVKKYGDVFELESHLKGVHLYLSFENQQNVNKPKEIPKEMINSILSRSYGWPSSVRNVFIPKSTCSTPISLFQHSKRNGLSRVFSSEKAELQELHSEVSDGTGNFITLFDHYHKTNFEIVAAPPSSLPKPDFDELCSERAHQCVDEASAPLFQKYQKKVVSEIPEIQLRPLLTYYESHLCQASFSMQNVHDHASLCSGNEKDLIFDSPFYYVMTRTAFESPVILCAGYFNNTIWVNN